MSTHVQFRPEVVEVVEALDRAGPRGFADKELEVWNQKLMQLPADQGFEVAAALTAVGLKLEGANRPGAELQLAQLALLTRAAMNRELESNARVEKVKQQTVAEDPRPLPPQVGNEALWKVSKKQ